MKNRYLQREMAIQDATIQIDRGVVGTKHFNALGAVGLHDFMVKNASVDEHPKTRPKLVQFGARRFSHVDH